MEVMRKNTQIRITIRNLLGEEKREAINGRGERKERIENGWLRAEKEKRRER